MRLKLSDVRRYNSTLIIFNIIALSAGALFFINNLTASYKSSRAASSSSSSSVSEAGGGRVRALNASAVLHSLSATFVRVETSVEGDSSGTRRLVLSVDAADITNFMNSWQRGFTGDSVRTRIRTRFGFPVKIGTDKTGNVKSTPHEP